MISKTGIWSEKEQVHHFNCQKLALNLAYLLKPDVPTIDFGCGDAYYIDFLRGFGFIDTLAIDGFAHRKDIVEADLSHEIYLPKVGQVISLEVGEHIPEKYEQTFLDNLARHCDSTMILSWAIPGQPGIGHVNCQPNSYIIQQMSNRDFALDRSDTEQLRNEICDETSWFKNTLMVFRK